MIKVTISQVDAEWIGACPDRSSERMYFGARKPGRVSIRRALQRTYGIVPALGEEVHTTYLDPDEPTVTEDEREWDDATMGGRDRFDFDPPSRDGR